jgi:tripartite-type tricarboxylate transporter receptor subunit TctC
MRWNCICAAVAIAAMPAAALAQAWPAKPVRIIVPLSPGGAVDTIARAMGQKYSEAFKQPFVVENRAGAGGTIGNDVVAKAPRDGYTLLVSSGSLVVTPSLYPNIPYDAWKDFAPAAQILSTYLMLVTNVKVPAASAKDLIALAKSQPGKLNFGSTGAGAGPHLVTELFNMEAGIKAAHIPYKGDAPLQPAMLANEVQYAIVTPSAVLGHIKAGKLRGLAVTGTRRAAVAPDLPTFAEIGLPGATYVGWIAVFAPGGTPRDILARIHGETGRALKAPDIVERLPGWGGEAATSTLDEFDALYRSDLDKFARVVKATGVKLQD